LTGETVRDMGARTSLVIGGVLADSQVSNAKSKPKPRPAPAGWWNNRVFYEIYVRGFQDSDGDGIGDFRGVTQRLDDLAALGVGGLWLMPIFESDTEHGYATTDYRSVERDYGMLAEFQQLLTESVRMVRPGTLLQTTVGTSAYLAAGNLI
jgi:alpha-amylase